jgi:hypothetical protein
LTADELEPPRGLKRFGTEVPVAAYHPRSGDGKEGDGNLKQQEEVAFGDAFAVLGIY